MHFTGIGQQPARIFLMVRKGKFYIICFGYLRMRPHGPGEQHLLKTIKNHNTPLFQYGA